MVKIDMKMPYRCYECMFDHNNECFILTDDNSHIRFDGKLPNCPLSPYIDEIRIGDEVSWNDRTGIIIGFSSDDKVCILWPDEMIEIWSAVYWVKQHRTGKYYPEVKQMLAKIGGEEDDRN